MKITHTCLKNDMESDPSKNRIWTLLHTFAARWTTSARPKRLELNLECFMWTYLAETVHETGRPEAGRACLYAWILHIKAAELHVAPIMSRTVSWKLK
jgi:hypothetical protein